MIGRHDVMVWWRGREYSNQPNPFQSVSCEWQSTGLSKDPYHPGYCTSENIQIVKTAARVYNSCVTCQMYSTVLYCMTCQTLADASVKRVPRMQANSLSPHVHVCCYGICCLLKDASVYLDRSRKKHTYKRLSNAFCFWKPSAIHQHSGINV